MAKSKPQTKPKSQRQAFIDAARKAECDKSEAAFEGKLRRIAKVRAVKKDKQK